MNTLEVREKIARDVARDGCALVSTTVVHNGESLSVMYTVGLGDIGIPELVVCSLPVEDAYVLLNTAMRLLQLGKISHDSPCFDLANLPVVFKQVHSSHLASSLSEAVHHAKGPIKALQIVIPDRAGLFPWEQKFDMALRNGQPSLYEPKMSIANPVYRALKMRDDMAETALWESPREPGDLSRTLH